MTAEGLSPVMSNYCYFLFGLFFFQLADNGPNLLETPYSATLESFINLHLTQQHSIPVFLSAITVDLFSHQTIDSSNECVMID
jgi:mitotic spindle assembly checkpoint protein MAD1